MDGQMDGQTNGWMPGQMDGQAGRLADRQTSWRADSQDMGVPAHLVRREVGF